MESGTGFCGWILLFSGLFVGKAEIATVGAILIVAGAILELKDKK